MEINDFGLFRLSYERAKQIVPEFAPAYEWFEQNAGTVGPRPFGDRRPSHLDITITSGQHGIHKPAGFDHALSIFTKLNSPYGDELYEFSDGTWLLEYARESHDIRDGKQYEALGTRALRKSMEDGLPIGVFKQVPGGEYQNLGLAFVESYDEEAGVFALHGPVNATQNPDIWSIVPMAEIQEELRESHIQPLTQEEIDNIQTDTRVVKALTQVVRESQGKFRRDVLEAYDQRCAITNFSMPIVLEAAHISPYRGVHSQRVSNGIALRSDLHRLFDAKQFSIAPDSFTVEIRDSLHRTEYRDIKGKKIHLPENRELAPAIELLKLHYDQFDRVRKQ